MPDNPVKIQCRVCKHQTNHDILCVDSYGKEYDGHYDRTENRMLKCLGCGCVSFHRKLTSSDPRLHEEVQIYPNPEGREPINEYWHLPSQLKNIYLETLLALDNRQPILTGIGVRAVIEAVCEERSASGNTLEDKIDDLVFQKVLTPEGADFLHKLRIIGSKSAHEVEPHSSIELCLALDVIDHVLMDVYLLPRKAQTAFK